MSDPKLDRVQLCRYRIEGKRCPHYQCRYAHSLIELRPAPPHYSIRSDYPAQGTVPTSAFKQMVELSIQNDEELPQYAKEAMGLRYAPIQGGTATRPITKRRTRTPSVEPAAMRPTTKRRTRTPSVEPAAIASTNTKKAPRGSVAATIAKRTPHPPTTPRPPATPPPPVVIAVPKSALTTNTDPATAMHRTIDSESSVDFDFSSPSTPINPEATQQPTAVDQIVATAMREPSGPMQRDLRRATNSCAPPDLDLSFLGTLLHQPAGAT